MRVIEIAGGPAAGFAGLVLAELGAEVIKIQPPGGESFSADPAASIDPDTAAYLDRRKRSLTLDLSRLAGADLCLRLVEHSEAVIDDLGPGGLSNLSLSYDRLRRTNPELVVVSISPFGATGPHANWEASELVVQAMGGTVQSTGFDGEPPFKIAGYAASFIAGLNAATALHAGVFGVSTGVEAGVHIDVSAQECFFQHVARHAGQFAYNGSGARREQSAMGRQGFPHTVMASDGWLYLLALLAEWEEVAFFLGLEPFITHEWSDADARAARWPEIEPHFLASIASRGRHDWFADASERGYTFAPIYDPEEVVSGPQSAARGFFKTATIGGQEVPCAGLPFPWTLPADSQNRPPEPGEHTEAVLAELLGLDSTALSTLRDEGAI
jgi:formyl-CoA transferase